MSDPVDIIAAIDSATGCQQCGKDLTGSVSDDFCSEKCQGAWSAERVGISTPKSVRLAMSDWEPVDRVLSIESAVQGPRMNVVVRVETPSGWLILPDVLAEELSGTYTGEMIVLALREGRSARAAELLNNAATVAALVEERRHTVRVRNQS